MTNLDSWPPLVILGYLDQAGPSSTSLDKKAYDNQDLDERPPIFKKGICLTQKEMDDWEDWPLTKPW